MSKLTEAGKLACKKTWEDYFMQEASIADGIHDFDGDVKVFGDIMLEVTQLTPYNLMSDIVGDINDGEEDRIWYRTFLSLTGHPNFQDWTSVGSDYALRCFIKTTAFHKYFKKNEANQWIKKL